MTMAGKVNRKRLAKARLAQPSREQAHTYRNYFRVAQTLGGRTMNCSNRILVGVCLTLATVGALDRPAAGQECPCSQTKEMKAHGEQPKSCWVCRLRASLARAFHHEPCPNCKCAACSGRIAPVAQTPAPKMAPIVAASYDSKPQMNPQPEQVNASGLKQEYVYHIGHAEDFSWVTGQLFYIHAGKGLWVVRYATVDTEDQYGGSIILAPVVNMKNFREGDLVSVQGEILNGQRASKNLGGPSYRADHVELIERADQ